MSTIILLGTFLKKMTFLEITNSLKVISLLGITVFLTGVTDLEAFFLISLISDTYIGSIYAIGAYIKGIYLEDAGIRDTCLKDTYVKSAYIKNVCIEGIYIAGPYIRSFWVGYACIYTGSTCIKAWDIYDMGTYVRSTYINSVNIVEYFGMYLQSFQNLEMEDTRLEIQTRASDTCIKSVYFCQNIKIRGIKLEI